MRQQPRLTLRAFRKTDWTSTIALDAEVFAGEISPASYFRDGIKNGHRGYCIRLDSNLVGYCLFDTAGKTLRIASIGIANAMRKRGLSKILMSRMVTYALDSGCETVWLQVNENNRTARNLYDSFGFQPLPAFTKPQYYADGGKALRFSLPLSGVDKELFTTKKVSRLMRSAREAL